MDFLYRYFLEPVLKNGWFNPVNTLVYGIGLLLGVILVFKLLKKLEVGVDGRFFLGILPFIFWASSTRAFRDLVYRTAVEAVRGAGNYQVFISDIGYNFSLVQEFSYRYLSSVLPGDGFSWAYSWLVALFPTPGSYFITFLVALISFFLGMLLERFTRIRYWVVMLTVGIILSVINVMVIPFGFLQPLIIVSGIMALWAAGFFGLSWLLKRKPLEKLTEKTPVKQLKETLTYQNTGVLMAHLLDATTTFTALTYFGYLEQHVVPRLFLPVLGPGSMFLLKILVVLPVLWLIDRNAEDRNFRNFLKVGVVILGLAPGLRDLLTLMVV